MIAISTRSTTNLGVSYDVNSATHVVTAAPPDRRVARFGTSHKRALMPKWPSGLPSLAKQKRSLCYLL